MGPNSKPYVSPKKQRRRNCFIEKSKSLEQSSPVGLCYWHWVWKLPLLASQLHFKWCFYLLIFALPILDLFETWLPSTSDMKRENCWWRRRVYNLSLSQPEIWPHRFALNNVYFFGVTSWHFHFQLRETQFQTILVLIYFPSSLGNQY